MTASESVKVIVRCRPMNQRERDLSCKVVLYMDPATCSCSIVNPEDQQVPPKVFAFDGVYYLDSTTEQIYNDIAYPLVEGVLEGYNGTVFAYGQTGCGKSYSMQGVLEPPTQRGIIPRSFEHIFEAIATAEDTKFLVHASYLEIYNEEIRDLLGKDAKKKLDLKEHPEKGVYIPGLSWHPVHNVKQCEQIMDKGWKNRSVGSTLMNSDSSRSHSIFTISLEMMSTGDDGEEHIRKGKLNLVDLAGSERQAKTGATGDRLKEATKINLSLSALGNVISALVDGKIKHIPYRDSKLTRLLQDSLGGNTKTLMVACLSPADNNYDETLSTLRYANRAKAIKNKPKINEDPKDAMLREYQEEIKRLKAAIGNGDATLLAPDDRPSELESEKERLKKEYEEMMEELKRKYQEEQRSNARLQDDLMFMRKQYENEVAKLNLTEGPAGNNSSAGHDANNLSMPVNMDDALKRLQQLEEQMVGGEKAHDKQLKEKRQRRKKAAEKKLRQLKEALHAVNEDDRSMLKVYDNIQEELKAKTDQLRKERKKVEAAQREIRDLQSEFEADRMDYLETIRRQDQQVKLLQQVLDKVQPCIRRECNYSNLDRIKAESIWDEDRQKWQIPELVIVKTRLPPAGIQPGGRAPNLVSTTAATAVAAAAANGYAPSPSPFLARFHTDDTPGEDKFLQKLTRGEQEDIAGNYFKPKRTMQLLKKAQEDASGGRHLFIHKAASAGSALNMAGLAPPSSRDPLAGLNLNSSVNGTFFGNGINPGFSHNGVGNTSSSSSSSYGSPVSPEVAAKKPLRLAALPANNANNNNTFAKKNRKKPKANYNTMDML